MRVAFNFISERTVDEYKNDELKNSVKESGRILLQNTVPEFTWSE
jgi:hypothetical protein